MIVTNDNTTMGPPLDITPASMKKKRGGRVKGCLSYSNSQVESLLDLMEQYLPVGTQEWEYIANEYSSAHPRPLRDVASLRRKFNTLAKKKTPTGNPSCPPFVRRAKKIFNALIDKCGVAPHGTSTAEELFALSDSQSDDNDDVDSNKDKIDDEDTSTTLAANSAVKNNHPEAPANENEVPRKKIKSIFASKKLTRNKKGSDGNGSVSTSEIIEIMKLDMQESKRQREDDMEYRRVQIDEEREERRLQWLRLEESNARFEQSSQMFLQLLGHLVNQ